MCEQSPPDVARSLERIALALEALAALAHRLEDGAQRIAPVLGKVAQHPRIRKVLDK